MQGLDALPPWAQITLSIIAGVATMAAWAKGMFSKLPRNTGDVVVPSVTVANAQVIEGLIASIKESNKLARDRQEMDLRLEFELKRLSEHTIETKQAAYRILDRNDRVDRSDRRRYDRDN